MNTVKKNKKIIQDMIINTIASAIPIIVLQVYILPKLSIILGDEKYGLFVTILAIFNIIPATLGNVLNNIRLLNNSKDSSKGDYNVLLYVFEIISTIIITILSIIYSKEIAFFNVFLIIVLGLLWLYREYNIVIFRIELNYVNVLKDSLVLTFGYIFGYASFLFFHYWQLIYIFGFTFSIIFISLNSNLHKEPFRKTKKFNKLAKDSLQLTISNFIARSITYADKLIIYPILGGKAVSVFYAASIFSKMTNLALSPITSVILSYVSKMKSNKKDVFNLTIKVSSIVLIIGSAFCYIISKPVLSMIYPQYVNNAMKYLPIILISMIFTTLSQIANPFILKFFKMKWQVIINSTVLCLYIMVSYILLINKGLIGFCYGVLITNFLKLLLVISLYYLKKEESEENEIG